MAQHMRRIGVLGGMGPEATVLFMQRVIEATPASDDSDHVPLLVDNNPQVPSRIRALVEGGADDPAPVLAEMASRLERCGAEALVMPCNTAHIYAAAIRAVIAIPFLSMVELAAREVAHAAPEGARIGILASPAVKQAGLFERALSESAAEILYPEDQQALLAAIRRLKASAADAEAAHAVMAGARDVIARGADLLLVGCSEFSLLRHRMEAAHPTVDGLDALVAATIRFARHGDTGMYPLKEIA